MTLLDRLPTYAPTVLRLSLSAVYLYFGISQLVNPTDWIGFVPDYAVHLSGMSDYTLVHLNGVLEVVTGSMLLIGLYVRLVASVLFLHLLVITSSLGFNALGVRDFGLSFCTLALALFGADPMALDSKMGKPHPSS